MNNAVLNRRLSCTASYPICLGTRAGLQPGQVDGESPGTQHPVHAHNRTTGQFSVANRPYVCVFGVREEAGRPWREDSKLHAEKAPRPGIEPGTFFRCEATVLTAAPPCRPLFQMSRGGKKIVLGLSYLEIR